MKRISPAILTIYGFILTAICGCGRNDEPAVSSYSNLPVLQSAHICGQQDDHLNPVRLLFRLDTLYVSYSGMARIDMYTPDLEKIGTLLLDDPVPIFPTDFIVADSELYVCDHSKGVIVVYGRDGEFKDSYGTLPDNTTQLRPFSLAYLGGVLYVGDAGQRKVLAISMADAPGITERGELILTIPNDDDHPIQFPGALDITPDGRMVIGDAGRGRVDVFTCDGRYIYSFDSLPPQPPLAPQGLAMDNITDSSLQDTASFDPSGLRLMGRIHVVDAGAGKIHMFNPLGKYIASYPEGESLQKPSDIAIDKTRRRVYVAEPVKGRILMYRYGE